VTSARDFDVVLYGATGFAGRHAVAYFTRHAPKDLRWAIAGRDRAKLAALGAGVPIVLAEAWNQAEVDALVARTRILVTTAGPFALLGDPLSTLACASAPTTSTSAASRRASAA
jgi:short subunit dehydrogenase-like uncharacterized protein